MVALVPSHLTIGSVSFPLETAGTWLNVSSTIEELRPLRLPLDQLVNGKARDQTIENVLADGFTVQEISLEPTDPTWSSEMFMDGLVNWRRLSGEWPDVANSMLAYTGFIYSLLVIPKPVAGELISILRRLRREIEAGQREATLDDTPVPPPRPLTPELKRLDELKGDREAAQKYREELYASRR